MKPYLPSNGTEGMAFESRWCDRCTKMPINQRAKSQCRYLLMALCGNHNGKWFADDGGAVCTAFKSRDEYNRNRTRRSREDINQMELFKQ